MTISISLSLTRESCASNPSSKGDALCVRLQEGGEDAAESRAGPREGLTFSPSCRVERWVLAQLSKTHASRRPTVQYTSLTLCFSKFVKTETPGHAPRRSRAPGKKGRLRSKDTGRSGHTSKHRSGSFSRSNPKSSTHKKGLHTRAQKGPSLSKFSQESAALVVSTDFFAGARFRRVQLGRKGLSYDQT